MNTKRTMPVISMTTFNLLSPSITDHELVQYDNIKYRNNPSEYQWQGKKILALPIETLALVAKKGTDEKGDYISLFMFMPKKQLQAA